MFLELLRAEEIAPPMIVAISGYRHDAMRAKVLRAGFDHYEMKPVGIERLRELVDEADRKAAKQKDRQVGKELDGPKLRAGEISRRDICET